MLTPALATELSGRILLLYVLLILRIVDPIEERPSRAFRPGTAALLLLLATTVCWLPRADAANPSTQPRIAIVEVRDLSTNAPIKDVRIQGSAEDGAKVEATTDGSGTAQVTLTDMTSSGYLKIKAARDGVVPLYILWSPKSRFDTPPDHFFFQMEKATTISGRVLDQDQQPIADATVVVDVHKRYPDSEQDVDVRHESTKTDANGRWSFSNVPELPDSVRVGTYHHLYLPDRSTFEFEKFEPLSALRDGSAVLRLRRGTRIDGTVLAPDGQPVTNADVFYGSGRDYGNSIPPVRTDAHGRFTLGIKFSTVSSLTARCAGFGPTLQPIRVGTDPQRVYLTLQPPHTLSGRVVDTAGRPIARASLFRATWRGSESLPIALTTDADGRFVLKDAPDDEIRVQVYAHGYLERLGDVPLVAGAKNQITLTPAMTIKGTVIDSETGRPIPEFRMVYGSVRNPGERLLWQRGSVVDESIVKAPGSFEYTFQTLAHQYLVRVQADGYLPEDSGQFTPNYSPRAFTFRLTKAEPFRGMVLNPDGSPARDGFVYLVPAGDYFALRNGDVPEDRRAATIHAKVAPDGSFSLPPQRETFLLVALGDAGFAVAHRRDLRGNDSLRLRPWARVAGTVTIDGKPAADLELSADPDRPPPVEGEPRLDHRFSFKTDANGRFELSRLMPGRHVIGRWVPNGVHRRIWFINMASLDAESGQVYDLRIGDNGRSVTGRLVLPKASEWLIRKASIEPKGSKDLRHPIGVQVFADGRFRADDLQPGDYTLNISIHEQPPDDSCGWGRLIAGFTHAFTVVGNTGDGPLDLGLLEPAEVGGRLLQVGDLAPDFTVKTLDGKDLTLADYKGKYLLLDFWATWCAPCVAEMPNLKAVHEAFAADPRFAIVSLSLNERPGDVEYFVKAWNLPWLHGNVGPESPIVSAYDATAIPASFLIGPDGKILAKNLRGEKLKATVVEALKP